MAERKRTTSGRSTVAIIGNDGPNHQHVGASNTINLPTGVNTENQASKSFAHHEVVTKWEFNQMVDQLNQKMANSLKTLTDKIDALLALKSPTTSRIMSETAEAMERKILLSQA